MPEELAKSLEALVPVFQKLEKALESDRKELQTDRNERRNFLRFMALAVFVVVVLTVVIIILQITFHHTANNNNARFDKISTCVFPPDKPSPPGTPLNKLSCYERQQIFATTEIKAILQEERDTLQDALDHEIPGNTYKLPEPSFVLPSQGGNNASTKGSPPTT